MDTSVFPITQPVIDLETKDPLGDIPSFENAVQFGAATCTPNPIAATGKLTIFVNRFLILFFNNILNSYEINFRN